MNIMISGIDGRMGKEVYNVCSQTPNIKVVCGMSYVSDIQIDGVNIYNNFDNIKDEVDCVIDFSHHSVTNKLIDFCVKKNVPIVVATTGQTQEENATILEASKKIPVFYSANMSIGIALLTKLAVETAKTMKNADIEIVETHHNRKLDAPSGTALMLANAINKELNTHSVVGRNGQRKREKDEIGIHSIRLGNVVGEHEVIIGTDSQTITLKHQAHTRTLFAEGAVTACEYLVGKNAGLYDMQTMIK